MYFTGEADQRPDSSNPGKPAFTTTHPFSLTRSFPNNSSDLAEQVVLSQIITRAKKGTTGWWSLRGCLIFCCGL